MRKPLFVIVDEDGNAVSQFLREDGSIAAFYDREKAEKHLQKFRACWPSRFFDIKEFSPFQQTS